MGVIHWQVAAWHRTDRLDTFAIVPHAEAVLCGGIKRQPVRRDRTLRLVARYNRAHLPSPAYEDDFYLYCRKRAVTQRISIAQRPLSVSVRW